MESVFDYSLTFFPMSVFLDARYDGECYGIDQLSSRDTSPWNLQSF